MIPFLDLKATHDELQSELDAAALRVLASGHYLLGKELEAFEAEFATYTEARHAIGLGSGLDALVLALEAMGVGPGDEVIVPANTYIATWLAVSHVGATPIGVEPLEGVWSLDPARIEAALTSRTKAIIPVHLYGQPCDLEPLVRLARARGLRVVEDAAQAHGARYRDRRIGAHGDAVCWSFYPSKNLGAYGDGGAVTTHDDAIADRIRVLRNYGSRVKYYHEVKGYNSRLDELQAAMLRVKLRHLDEWNARRSALARRYLAGLAGVIDLRLPRTLEGTESVWHLFVVDHPRRDALQTFLADHGIATLIHYPVPPHLSKAYAERGIELGTFPITERACATHLSLPMGPHLKITEVDRVCEVLGLFASLGEDHGR
jgi:dTDP-4-amino-4,6-dideoxygalactose transaminase